MTVYRYTYEDIISGLLWQSDDWLLHTVDWTSMAISNGKTQVSLGEDSGQPGHSLGAQAILLVLS